MLSTAIFVYAATSPVNGYFGGSLYAKQGGKRALHCGRQTPMPFRNNIDLKSPSNESHVF